MKTIPRNWTQLYLTLGGTIVGVIWSGTPVPAYAAEALDHGDTAWTITATALVLFMTVPGLALFYGGLVKTKNVLSVLGQCLAIAGWMTMLWVTFGYSLATTEGNLFIGGGSKFLLTGLTLDSMKGSIPESVFVAFQTSFAIITPALIVGAFAERMKFGAMLVFMVVWFTLSYLPLWHMTWGGGLFATWGVLDFAGGIVVHINAGIAALVLCIMIGPRKGYPSEPFRPHSLVLTVLGAGMLWFGWIGFNAGSQLAADGVAGMALLVTLIAPSAALIVWMLIEWKTHGKPSILGMATAVVAGLAAITPACGTVGPGGAVLIGSISAIACYFAASKMKQKFGYDDSLDVFGVHGVGGLVGVLLAGLCAAKFLGGSGIQTPTVTAQFIVQLQAAVITIVWSGVVSFFGYYIANSVTNGARVSDEGEQIGLDLTDHDESGYVG